MNKYLRIIDHKILKLNKNVNNNNNNNNKTNIIVSYHVNINDYRID